jgi:glutamyl-tRNA reductase
VGILASGEARSVAVALVVVGCNYRSAPLEIRERLGFDRTTATSALAQFRHAFPNVEAVLLSTCNRVELYAATRQEDGPLPDALDRWLAHFHGLPYEKVAPHLYRYEDQQALRHLVAVASSLDSMVVGESQILSQVKEAYQLARDARATGPALNFLFQRAISIAKEVQTTTGITRGKVSIASIAVEFACQVFEPHQFRRKTILVIGAGKMGNLTLRHLAQLGPGRILVTNRSPEKAQELARQWQGQAVSFEELDRYLTEADLILSTTGSPVPIVDRPRFQRILAARNYRPVVIIDIAVPRDFAPEVGELEHVYLYNIDDLEIQRAKNLMSRQQEVARAWALIDEAAVRLWEEWKQKDELGPVVTLLRQRWSQVREEELRRLFAALPHLSDRDRERIAHAFRRYENRLLHLPTSALRETDHTRSHSLLDALKRLFRLS